jgi:2-hydroxycyclohexanecarboxyl-CoA dehydrogenase
MSEQFAGKVVLIGGASGGVGRAAARMLAERGARLVLQYRTKPEPVEDLADTFGPEHVLAVQADLTDPQATRAFVDAAVSRFGRFDGFLNTIGGSLHMQPFLDVPPDVAYGTIAVEFLSVIDSARAVLPHLVANGGGRIVFVGSDSGKVGTSGEAISAACRGGLISFAKSLAREFARHQVLVNVVCPGPTDTSLWEELVDNDEFGGKLGNAMIRAIPLRRIARPQEVAAAAVFLLSDEASFITGQAVSVSGGLTMS